MKCPNFKSPGLVIQTQHSSIWYLDTNTVGAMEQSIGLYQAKWGTKQDICLCQLPGTLPDPALCATQAWPTRQGVPHTRTQQRPCKHWLCSSEAVPRKGAEPKKACWVAFEGTLHPLENHGPLLAYQPCLGTCLHHPWPLPKSLFL